MLKFNSDCLPDIAVSVFASKNFKDDRLRQVHAGEESGNVEDGGLEVTFELSVGDSAAFAEVEVGHWAGLVVVGDEGVLSDRFPGPGRRSTNN